MWPVWCWSYWILGCLWLLMLTHRQIRCWKLLSSVDLEEIVQYLSQCDNFSNFLLSISKKISSSPPNCLWNIEECLKLLLYHACSLNWAGKRVCSSCEALWCAASEVWVYTLLRHALLWSPPAATPPPHTTQQPLHLRQPCPWIAPLTLSVSGSKNTHMGLAREKERDKQRFSRQTDVQQRRGEERRAVGLLKQGPAPTPDWLVCSALSYLFD